MNNNRRKHIEMIAAQLYAIETELEELAFEELDAVDNMPESLQDSEKAERMRDISEELTTAASEISETIYRIESASE